MRIRNRAQHKDARSGRAQLGGQAGQAVEPGLVVGGEAEVAAVAARHAHHDQARPLGAQPGHDLAAPPHAFGVLPAQVRAGDGQFEQRAGDFAHRLQPPLSLFGNLFEGRTPHGGVRITDQRHRRRRTGFARNAFGLTDVEPGTDATVAEHRRLVAGCLGERRIEIRWDGT